MNLRLFLFRLLLSCVLLGTQQMGLTHALSHLHPVAGASENAPANAPANATAPQPSARDRSDRAAPNPGGLLQADKACEQCLAFAQIDAALTNSLPGTPPLPVPAIGLPHPAQPGLLPVTACVFHSRAPPVLA